MPARPVRAVVRDARQTPQSRWRFTTAALIIIGVGAVYVALGDSMSIDDYAGGVGRGAASLLYRNRDTDFPDWAGRDLQGAGFTAQILAQDGATTVDVLQRQLPLLPQPDLVTITMGGNDLLAAYGDTPAGEATIDRVAAVGERILRRLRATTGSRTQIMVTTVYDPSDGTGTAGAAGLPPWPDGPALVRSLNAVLTEMAGRHGAVVADVHAHFFGHGSTAGDPAQAQARPANRDLWYCGVVEPNAWGAHEIRSVWWNTLTGYGWLS
jgi:lysophospholipase L1-like esterase